MSGYWINYFNQGWTPIHTDKDIWMEFSSVGTQTLHAEAYRVKHF